MKESPLGFQYDWADLEPIRPLICAVIVGQALGAGAALLLAEHLPGWFERLWFGAALATLPAFLIGLAVQAHDRPGSLGEHRVLVRRFGLVAAALAVFAIAMPPPALA